MSEPTEIESKNQGSNLLPSNMIIAEQESVTFGENLKRYAKVRRRYLFDGVSHTRQTLIARIASTNQIKKVLAEPSSYLTWISDVLILSEMELVC